MLDTSDSYSDLLLKIGLNPKGGNPATLKKIIKEYDLDETILCQNRSALLSRSGSKSHEKTIIPIEDILSGSYTKPFNSSYLLKRLIREGYKQLKCEICGIISWMGKPISFHLHHEDGDHQNNKLENLRILCPNCHSQTETFAGKNRKIKEKKDMSSIVQIKNNIQINKNEEQQPILNKTKVKLNRKKIEIR